MDILEKDCTKVYAEVNQIVNQRFQVVTTAIVLWAAMNGWLLSAGFRESRPPTPAFIGAAIFLLLLILAALFMLYMSLLKMLRIWTAYLIVKHGSHFEQDWNDYRKHPRTRHRWGYSTSGATVFVFLGVLSLICPVGLLWFVAPEHRLQITPLIGVVFTAFVLYTLAICMVVRFRDSLFGSEGETDWQHVLQDRQEPYRKAFPVSARGAEIQQPQSRKVGSEGFVD